MAIKLILESVRAAIGITFAHTCALHDYDCRMRLGMPHFFAICTLEVPAENRHRFTDHVVLKQ
jgi:hypothetical protein